MATLHYNKGITQIIPYPYFFAKQKQNLELDTAPIVIVGDRLGHYLGKFTKTLASEISKDLDRPIKVISYAQEGEGLHRTLQKIKSLKKLPFIIIYLGGSEEYYERKFETQNISTILKNFKKFDKPINHTALLLFPEISRFLFSPIKWVKLTSKFSPDLKRYSDLQIQKRNEVNFKLYQHELNELLSYANDYNSVVIAISQPFNLDAAPKKSCDLSIDEFGKELMQKVIEKMKQEDYKSAYNQSKELVLIAPANAKAHFLHGQVSKALNKNEEAIKHLKYAIAYDCQNWRGNPVYNAILKKMAKKNEALYFDFNKMLQDNWRSNVTFHDDIYPQNFYTEKMLKVIAGRIKSLLKL